MRLEIGESYGEPGLITAGPRFKCEVSEEAGRHYRVSSAWKGNGYLYVVTADTGAKVAECKAREKGEGAVVVDEATVYKKAHGTDVTRTLKRGDAVVAICLESPWQFCEKAGRAQIAFLDETSGNLRGGWIGFADLAKFIYFFCNYQGQVGDFYGDGYPLTPGKDPFALGVKRNWSNCFLEARDAKLKELRAAWAKEKAATSAKAPPGELDKQPEPVP